MSLATKRLLLGLGIGAVVGFWIQRPTAAVLAVLDGSAWPASLLISSIIFRQPISRLIDRIKKVSSKDHSLEFEPSSPEEVREYAKIKSEDHNQNNGIKDKGGEVHNDEIMAEIDPAAAIISSWSRVYGALLKYTENHGFEHRDKPTTTNSMLTWIRVHRYLPGPIVNELRSLFQKRNEAAHATPEVRMSFTSLEAKHYAESCREIRKKLEV